MTPPIFTTGERRAAKRCLQRWWWGFREGLLTPDVNMKLWFGIGVHIALARWYGPGLKRRKDFIDKFLEYCDQDDTSQMLRSSANGELAEAKWMEARDLGEGMLKNYVEYYGRDRDWDIIFVEEPFQIEIPRLDDTAKTLAVFTSAWDGVFRDKRDGQIKLIEHKTAAQIRTAHLALDEQAGAYWALATQVLQARGILGRRERIHGIEYNILRKALPPTDRPRNDKGLYLNKNGSVSKQQPPPFFHREFIEKTRIERSTQIRRIAEELTNLEDYRTGARYITKNPTMDCFWDCAFYTLCQLHEQGAEWREYRDAIFQVQDPYARYRKSTEE